MYGFAQRGLIGMLAMALVVAGLPPSHANPSHTKPSYAKPCASSVDVAPAKHLHHDMAAVAPSPSAHHHEAIPAGAPQSPEKDGHHDAAACQCLNCSQCVASFVALVCRDIQLQRQASPISYGFFVQGDPSAFFFIDPGIPIASM